MSNVSEWNFVTSKYKTVSHLKLSNCKIVLCLKLKFNSELA